MRTSYEILLELLVDPSIMELILSGPGMTTRDFLVGLAWIVATSLVSKLAIDLAWPLIICTGRRLKSRVSASLQD